MSLRKEFLSLNDTSLKEINFHQKLEILYRNYTGEETVRTGFYSPSTFFIDEENERVMPGIIGWRVFQTKSKKEKIITDQELIEKIQKAQAMIESSKSIYEYSDTVERQEWADTYNMLQSALDLLKKRKENESL